MKDFGNGLIFPQPRYCPNCEGAGCEDCFDAKECEDCGALHNRRSTVCGECAHHRNLASQRAALQRAKHPPRCQSCGIDLIAPATICGFCQYDHDHADAA